MKYVLATITALFTTASIWAVPAKKIVQTIPQSDGTTLTVIQTGDERFHTFVTADGIPVEQADNGDFHYLTAQGISTMAAHEQSHRSDAERKFLEENSAEMSIDRIAAFRTAKSLRNGIAAKVAAENTDHIPTTGENRIPVLLLEYTDYPFRDGTEAKQTFKTFFEDGPESARQYFIDQSNGKYTPQFDIYGPFTLSKGRSSYGGNLYDGSDRGVGEMVAEGCLGLDDEIDFSLYDNDGDGECDVVIVIYAGDGEASSTDPDRKNAIWPCQWTLESSDYSKSIQLDNTKINKFGVFNELSGSDLTQIDGIGTFCHEFSHCLGLPDFYPTNYGGYFGMSDWSLMDYGCYNNNGYTPIGYSAFEKNYMGWLDYIEPVENTRYTMPVFNAGNADTDIALKIASPTSVNEYYIVENRAQQGWDRYIKGEGLMITHVTYDRLKWGINAVNNYRQQGMTIIPADNELDNTSPLSLAGDLWPYNGNDALTDESVPAATLNLGAQLHMGKPLTEMTRNDDGTISLWYIRAELPQISVPEIISIEHTDTEITATWQHETDAEVTYTLEAKPHSDLETRTILSEDFTDNAHDWTTGGFTELSNDGIRLGSANNVGTITSLEFIPTESSITSVLNAKYYNNDASSLRISTINDSGSAADSKDITLTGQNATHTITLATESDKPTKLKIETLANKKRAYVAGVTIYDGDVTSMLDQATKSPDDDGISTKTINGITDLTYTITGLEKDATYDIRIKAVAVDTDSYIDSEWSSAIMVDLSEASAGIQAASADSDSEVRYYNMQGIPIDGNRLSPGIYIRKSATSATKILIR